MLRFFILLLFLCWVATPAQGQLRPSFAYETLADAQKNAKQAGKKVVIDFYAKWCGYCKKMENEVYPVANVGKTLSNFFHFVRIDIESDELLLYNGRQFSMKELAGGFGIRSTPSYLFLDTDGKIIGAQPGFLQSDLFTSILSFVGSDAYKSQKFEDYQKARME